MEYERAYVFTTESFSSFKLKSNNNFSLCSPVRITDYYLSKNKRIRHIQNQYEFCVKTGDKKSGQRHEQSFSLPKEVAQSLISDAVLVVEKERFKIEIESFNNSFNILVDFIHRPMNNILILEIESLQHKVPENITQILFKQDLIECPLSSYDYFVRRIGVCGGPSSGKSETAKYLSHTLNTEFGANAFHVAEFATTFIQKYGRLPSMTDQFFIWHGQNEREQNVATRANITISDCPSFLSYIYLSCVNQDVFDENKAFYFSKMYKRALYDVPLYSDIIFLNIINYVDNNVRYQTKQEAINIQQKIKTFLDNHKIRYMDSNFREKSSILKNIFFLN